MNGSDQFNKIEEFGKTLQNLIDEKAKEKVIALLKLIFWLILF